MKTNLFNKIYVVLFFLAVFQAKAVDGDSTVAEEYAVDSSILRLDSIQRTFNYQTGTVQLKGGIATLKVPAGFKYLNPEQSEQVLTQFWGNPEGSNTLGMLFPDTSSPLFSSSWAFVITYDELGFVKDDDADDIDYDDLLKDLQKETNEANPEREKLGYEKITFVGWASKPFYDKDKKILHWAKELKFGEAEENTLNYNIRILGRKGVLVLNAVAGMSQLAEVEKNIASVSEVAQFGDGYKYSDFNPDIDEVAAWTIGGLVAGKVLAKVGMFAFLGKFLKVIIFGIVALGGAAWKFITGKKEKAEENSQA